MSLTKSNIIFATLVSFMLVSTSINTIEGIKFSSSLTQQSKTKDTSVNELDKSKLDEFKLKKLAYIAAYFGINTKGKSIEQLRAEIEQAKHAQPEKWELLKKEMHDKKIKMLQQKEHAPLK